MSLDELKGKVNEAKGKMNDDQKEELKGKAQQGLGKAKDKADEVTDDLAGKINDQLDKKDEGDN
ncbi:CsbD family protein [Enterococcus sp. CSURQ0835]|uniref:CsbD family protein n=1 Tax=Enterococcus sp. CSURQ0835 TaxID=2681394 RepID=UPI00135C12BA|nr:CsbD family protein [Enterococcus sp. CSURQ0835]